MATQLKNTLAVAALAPGASVVLPHGLDNGQIPVAPDVIFLPSPDLEVTASGTTSITVENQGASDITGTILVEAWHTIERAFGDVANEDLPVKPVIIVGAEPAGEPPQPPPQPLTIRTIYARASGNDVTGNGSLANPYRTIQRAVRDYPTVIPPNVMYVIDGTGTSSFASPEVLPAEFTLPPTVSAQWFDLDFANPFFLFYGPLNIIADPQLVAAIPPADAVVAGADIASSTQDANTGLRTITLNVARASWAADALKGKFVIGAAGERSVIVSSTNLAIEISSSTNPTAPFQIMEPSAVLQGAGASAEAAFHGSLSAMGNPSLTLQGLGILPPVGGGGNYAGLMVTSACQVYNFLCDIDGYQVEQGNASRHQHCYLHSSDGAGIFISSLFIAFQQGVLADTGFLAFSQCVEFFGLQQYFDGVDVEMLVDRTTIRGASIPGGTLRNSEIRNAPGDGFKFHGGDFFLRSCNVVDSALNGVTANQGSGLLVALSVKGTGNGGFGVYVDDGTQVLVDNDTDVTGVEGDMKVGGLVARTWADFRSAGIIQNEYDLAVPVVGPTVHAVSAATAAAPVAITTAAPHGLVTGQYVRVSDVYPGADGVREIVVTGASTFDLVGSNAVGQPVYVAGGTISSEGTSGSRLYQ